MTPSNAVRAQSAPVEGVAVIGEALQRVAPESVEFVVEITAAAPTATQALHDHKAKTVQISQAVGPLGVQRTDLQTITMNLLTTYTPLMGQLPFAPAPQLASGAIGSFASGAFGAATALSADVQFGAYQARSLVRVVARETARVGEIVDALTKSGATLAGGFSFRVADEAAARNGALEAAGKDARAKAEILAQTAGKLAGDPLTIVEEMVVSNGVYSAMRTQMPLAFGPGTPALAGELEYYARVTASFRFQ